REAGCVELSGDASRAERIIDPSIGRDAIDAVAGERDTLAGEAKPELRLRLRLLAVERCRHASGDRLAEQGSELFEPRHAQGHLAERQGCSGRERQLALAFGTFPVETRDGEMQRAVALAIDTGGERERRAQEIALRRDLSVGRRWNILEPQ